MKPRDPRLALLLCFLLSVRSLWAAGIVLEIPIPKANAGGGASAAGAMTQSPASALPPGASAFEMLGRTSLPSLGVMEVHSPSAASEIEAQRALRAAPQPGASETAKDSAAGSSRGPSDISAERAMRTDAPVVGSESLREELKGVQEGAREIGRTLDGEGPPQRETETSAAAGRKVFDGSRPTEGNVNGLSADMPFGPPQGFTPARPTGPESYSYAAPLLRYGVPAGRVARLERILAENHPGKQDEIYHGKEHSQRVAKTLAAVVSAAPSAVLNDREKALLLVAAALHDVDPKRVPGTPARVAATLEFIDTDPGVKDFLSGVGLDTPRGRGQLKTLIKFTDFHMDPAAMARIQEEAREMAGEHFGPLAGRWTGLGRLLAFADQSAMYLGTVAFAKRAVDGLAAEIRAVSNSPMPTNETLQSGTAKFLGPLLENPYFQLLPRALQENFREVYAYYARLAGPQAPAAAEEKAADAAAKRALLNAVDELIAPLDALQSAAAARLLAQEQDAADREAARFLSFERSMMGRQEPTAAQHRQLFTVWLEDRNFSAASPLGQALLARFFPEEAAAKASALARVDPRFAESADLIVSVSQESGIPISRFEELISRNPDTRAIVASNRDPEITARVLAGLAERERVEGIVSAYPRNAQGDFLRSLGRDMLARSGKSVEEVAREGVFAYVNFSGNSVRSATTGRDPDNASPDQVFYVRLERDNRWTIGGYRKNMKRPGSDAEYIRLLRNWLVQGGIPDAHFSQSTPR